MPKLNIGDLNKLYSSAEEVDRHIFAEQRSNVQLAMGEHYSNRTGRFFGRVRDTVSSSSEDSSKLRITKNHIHRITRVYINNIVTQCPGVSIMPQRENELSDQKSAELNSAVWEDVKTRHRLSEKIPQWADDFVTVGEVCVKVFWDPYAGTLLGYEQAEGPGGPVMDDNGEPAADKGKPIFTGDFVFERVMGFNLLRDPNSKEMSDGYLMIRKMQDIASLKTRYAGDEEKLKLIQPSTRDVYTVFEGSSGNFYQTKDQTMIWEFYWPKSETYPTGYFCISTEHGILEEGEIPFGIYPLIVTGFDEIQTTPRKRSLIKQLRPTQAEINRTASQIATHQVTLGDDKLMIQSGSKVTQSSTLPGVRVLNYSGAPPVHLAGRAGDQYYAYLENQIAELYQIAGITHENEVKPQNADVMVELMKSIKQKKQFSMYVDKFERFLVDLCKTTLSLAKEYYPDSMLVPAVGRNEFINIAEFRTAEALGYKIKVEPQVEDYETKMGKLLTINSTMQYVGSQLTKEDIGKLMRVGPYTNKEKIFEDWTIDYDNATNDILSLDRGENPEPQQYENHNYMIQRLSHRMKQADFRFLDPMIQQNYAQHISYHEDAEAEKLATLKAMESEMIPATGPLVKADIYVTDPESPTKTARAKLPMDALQWLIDRLNKQGINMQEMERLQQTAAAEVAEKFLNEGRIPMPPMDRERLGEMGVVPESV